jgi:hypothetical protein
MWVGRCSLIVGWQVQPNYCCPVLSCPVLQVRAVVAEAKEAAQVGFWIIAMTQHKTTAAAAEQRQQQQLLLGFW